MKILFAAAEAAPLAKVGGMADVVGALPPVLRAMGHDVRIIMPFYGVIPPKLTEEPRWVWTTNVMFQEVQVFETVLPKTKVPLYLVGHPSFMPQRIYYGDDEDWRFTLFANTVAEFSWNHWKPNLIHCHDWHTGMIPVWMHQTSDIGTVYTIHNLAYQGPWTWRLQEITWVPWYMQSHNTMAAGIKYADRVNTVSPTYAQQICTPTYGEGLDGMLSLLKPWGILNGIDTKQYNPVSDPFLVQNYDGDRLEDRSANKEALQRELGLVVSSD
ncbi:MAG: glycosyltransferase, partial [Oscillatoriales cyanobacterium SM2_2_1]|nr:glycosyltransferase [Oscillatoriales cyanobacterium SM2_2_1]